MKRLACLVLVFASGWIVLGDASAQKVGGFREVSVKNADVIAAARAAVEIHAEKEKVKLALTEIVSATEQVVAGTNYRLRLRVTNGEATRIADAIVWHKTDRTYALTYWVWEK